MRRRTGALFGATFGAVFALIASLLVPGHAGAVVAQATVTPTVWIGLSTTSVAYGGSVDVRARVTDGAGDLVNHRVRIAVQPLTGGSFRDIVELRTSSTGRIGYTLRPRVGYRVKVWSVQTARHIGVASTTKTFVVRPGIYNVRPAVTSLAVRGLSKTFTGAVHGGLAGQTATLQQSIGGRWRTVTSTKVRSDGTFDLRFVPSASGWSAARIVFPPSGGLAGHMTSARKLDIKSSLDALVATKPKCYGAAAINGCSNRALDGLLLPATVGTALSNDSGGAYGCWTSDPSAVVRTCSYGSTATNATRIALTGDSHSASYLGGFLPYLKSRNIRLDTYMGKQCRWGDSYRPGMANCYARTKAITAAMKRVKYDVIVVAHLRWKSDSLAQAERDATSRAAEWRTVTQATGADIVAILDYPYLTSFGCLANAPFLLKFTCAEPRAAVMRGVDPHPLTVQKVGAKAHVFDPDSKGLFCRKGVCPYVTGNVAMYRDNQHLTGTYSRTIAPTVLNAITAYR